MVIAPILGSGHADTAMGSSCCAPTEQCASMSKEECEAKGCTKTDCENMMAKCDMTKCATMTKEECAKMCDSLKCTPEQKEMCLSHYGADGKFIADNKDDCCAKDGGKVEVSKKVEMVDLPNGKVKATYTVTSTKVETIKVFEGTEKEVSDKINAMK